MATLATLRAASTTSLHSSSSDCRHGPQILARPCLSSICCTSSSSGASLSSFSSRSIPKVLRAGGWIKSRARGGDGAARVGSVTRCESESSTDGKTPFGYTRKDVIAIGLGLLGFGIGLKYGLEFLGVDSIKAGNAVQLTMVLGLTVGWISTYIFRVSSKEMTYAKQLKDYENKVMEKRLEEMPEAELESMLAQIEEEKRILKESRDKLR